MDISERDPLDDPLPQEVDLQIRAETLGTRNYRVVIIDDSERDRRGLRRRLEPENKVVGEAGSFVDGIALIDQFEQIIPDVVLLDGSLGHLMTPQDQFVGADGAELYEYIKSNHPGVVVIPFTGSPQVSWGDTPIGHDGSHLHTKNWRTAAEWVSRLMENEALSSPDL